MPTESNSGVSWLEIYVDAELSGLRMDRYDKKGKASKNASVGTCFRRFVMATRKTIGYGADEDTKRFFKPEKKLSTMPWTWHPTSPESYRGDAKLERRKANASCKCHRKIAHTIRQIKRKISGWMFKNRTNHVKYKRASPVARKRERPPK